MISLFDRLDPNIWERFLDRGADPTDDTPLAPDGSAHPRTIWQPHRPTYFTESDSPRYLTVRSRHWPDWMRRVRVSRSTPTQWVTADGERLRRRDWLPVLRLPETA